MNKFLKICTWQTATLVLSTNIIGKWQAALWPAYIKFGRDYPELVRELSLPSDNAGHPRGHLDPGDGGPLSPVLCQHLLAHLLRVHVRV